MYKSREDQLAMDLRALAKVVPGEPGARAQSKAFVDLIAAICHQGGVRRIERSEVEGLLGAPDRRRESGGDDVWDYDWLDDCQGIEYTATTSFVLRGGTLAGLIRDEGVVYFEPAGAEDASSL
jgi:hypothetical protein